MANQPKHPMPTPEEAMQVEAVFANTFTVTAAGSCTRLSFAEYYPDHGSIYHTAIVMPTEGIQGLAELLTRIVRENQDKISEKVKQQSH